MAEKGISFGFRFPGSEAHLADLGIGWVRESVRWGLIQPSRDAWNWADCDSLLTCLRRIKAATGAKVLLTVRAWSPWAGQATPGAAATSTTMPTSLTEYSAFLSRLHRRASDVVDVYQIENEMDWVNFWAGTADEYIRLVATAKDVLPTVALGGWTSGATMPGAEKVRPKMVAFAKTVLARAEYDYADLHCYPANPADIAKQVAWVRARTAAPILCTELGWEGTHTEAQQAADLTARVTAAQGAEAAFWFLLRDTTVSGIPANCRQNGLVTTDGKRKLAFAAFREVLA